MVATERPGPHAGTVVAVTVGGLLSGFALLGRLLRGAGRGHEPHSAATKNSSAAPATSAGASGDPPAPGSCAALQAVYTNMAQDFLNRGLDTAGIAALAPWFDNLDADGVLPWPKPYSHLPPRAVRLLVIPLEASTALCAHAQQLTQAVLRLLPQDCKVFCNARQNYHCTVFHTSQPSDPRPDPFDAAGGGAGGETDPGRRPAPTDDTLRREAGELARLVASTPPPQLRIDRVLMASSGVLLLTWTDPSEQVAQLRQRLHASFPGRPAKQATILHSSLLRVLAAQQLPPQVVTAIAAECDKWTQQLRGRCFSPSELWYVLESEFSTIAGERECLPLAGSGSASGVLR